MTVLICMYVCMYGGHSVLHSNSKLHDNFCKTHCHRAPSHATFTRFTVSSTFNMDSGSKDTAELKEKLKGKVSLTMKRNTENIEIEKRLSASRKEQISEDSLSRNQNQHIQLISVVFEPDML